MAQIQFQKQFALVVDQAAAVVPNFTLMWSLHSAIFQKALRKAFSCVKAT